MTWGPGLAEPTVSSFPALLVRPLGKEHTVSRLLRVMQCLSRIEEGENLGMAIFCMFFSGLPYVGLSCGRTRVRTVLGPRDGSHASFALCIYGLASGAGVLRTAEGCRLRHRGPVIINIPLPCGGETRTRGGQARNSD